MGNAGEARLDVVALGRDEITAAVNKVNGELDKMREKLALYEKAQRGTADGAKVATQGAKGVASGIDEAKGKLEGLNKGREVFENLRSNFLFVGGAIAGAVVALGGWIDKLFEANSAAKWWREHQADVRNNADAIAKIITGLGDLYRPGKGPLDGLIGRDVEEKLRRLRDDLVMVKKAAAEVASVGKLATMFGAEDGNQVRDILGAMVGKIDEAGASAKELKTIQDEITRLTRLERDYREEAADAIARQEREASELAQAEYTRLAQSAINRGTGGAATGADLDASMTQTSIAGGAEDAKRQREQRVRDAWREVERQREAGARAARAKKEADDQASRQEMAAALAEDYANRERIRRDEAAAAEAALAAQREAAEESRLEMSSLLAEQHEHFLDQLRREAESVDQLASSLLRLGDIVGNALPASWATMANSIARTAAELAKMTDEDNRAEYGLAKLGAAVFKFAAAEAKTARERFAWKAAESAAEAASSAARLDFWGMGAHLFAAGLWGVASVRAGGGGSASGGAGARSAGGGARTSGTTTGGGEGGGTFIYNFNQLMTDGQSVTRSIHEHARSARNNGYSSRGGT